LANTYDISLYTHDARLIDQSVSLSLDFPASGPKKVSGLDKLLQMVIKNLIDKLGSAQYDTSMGTDFTDTIFRTYEEGEAYAVTSTAMQLVQEKMKSENEYVDNDDEKLDRIVLEDIKKSTSGNGWEMSIRMYAVSGNSAEYLYKFSQ